MKIKASECAQDSLTPALERGIKILLLLSTGSKPQTAGALSAASGMPRASFYRCLQTLTRHRLVEQDLQSGLYHLGQGLMQLGFQARRQVPLVKLAQECLQRLALEADAMSELAILCEPWTLLMLDTWPCGRTPLNVQARSGMFFPISHTHAYGLCYLAFDCRYTLSRYLQRKATAAPADLASKLAEYRANEAVLYRQHESNRVTRVVVPLFDPDAKGKHLLACLGLVCAARELNAARAQQWVVLLRREAKALFRLL